MNTKKVAFITGATSGIGYQTALRLAQSNHDLIICGRSPNKLKRTQNDLFRENKSIQIQTTTCELSNLDECRALAKTIQQLNTPIDILIHNAGYLPANRVVTQEGFEQSFTVHYLSPFLLTGLLMPLLRSSTQKQQFESDKKSTSECRIITLSSIIHKIVRIPWDDLNFEKFYWPYYTYAVGKLAITMFTIELAERLKSTRITAHAVHPGVISSGFGDSTTPFLKLGISLVRPLLATSQTGADAVMHAATHDSLPQSTGGYYEGLHLKKTNPQCQDAQARARLWNLTEKMLGYSYKV